MTIQRASSAHDATNAHIDIPREHLGDPGLPGALNRRSSEPSPATIRHTSAWPPGRNGRVWQNKQGLGGGAGGCDRRAGGGAIGCVGRRLPDRVGRSRPHARSVRPRSLAAVRAGKQRRRTHARGRLLSAAGGDPGRRPERGDGQCRRRRAVRRVRAARRRLLRPQGFAAGGRIGRRRPRRFGHLGRDADRMESRLHPCLRHGGDGVRLCLPRRRAGAAFGPGRRGGGDRHADPSADHPGGDGADARHRRLSPAADLAPRRRRAPRSGSSVPSQHPVERRPAVSHCGVAAGRRDQQLRRLGAGPAVAEGGGVRRFVRRRRRRIRRQRPVGSLAADGRRPRGAAAGGGGGDRDRSAPRERPSTAPRSACLR